MTARVTVAVLTHDRPDEVVITVPSHTHFHFACQSARPSSWSTTAALSGR
jgi:hypothetical protein